METKQYPDMECDVVIAGCGVAGLYAALNLPTSTRVIMLSKGAVDECDSMLAQGGICVLPEGSDYDAFFEDTMHAGHYENRRESVDIMIRSSRSVINDLLAMGVEPGLARAAVRVSLGRDTRADDVHSFIETFVRVTDELKNLASIGA